MLHYDRFPVARLYELEVSGWDSAESFFVEKCDLEWNEDSGKQVALKRTLNDSAILLVRLLQLASLIVLILLPSSRIGWKDEDRAASIPP